MCKCCNALGAWWGSDRDPPSLHRWQCARVCVAAGELISFSPALSAGRARDARRAGAVWRTRQNWRSWELGGRGMWPWRPPSTEHPPRGELAEEGGEEKFLARQRQLRAAPRIVGAARAVPVPGTASPASRRAQPKPEEPAAGSAAPFCPWAPKPAPGPQGSGSARPGWERTGEHWPRREKGRSARRRPSGSGHSATCQCAPAVRGVARGWGSGDRPPPPSRLLLGLLLGLLPGGGRCPPSPSPPAG